MTITCLCRPLCVCDKILIPNLLSGIFDRFKDPSSGQSMLIEKLQKQVKELVRIEEQV